MTDQELRKAARADLQLSEPDWYDIDWDEKNDLIALWVAGYQKAQSEEH